MTERERVDRTIAAARDVARRVARPGQEFTITHWWGSQDTVPQSITVKEIA